MDVVEAPPMNNYAEESTNAVGVDALQLRDASKEPYTENTFILGEAEALMAPT